MVLEIEEAGSLEGVGDGDADSVPIGRGSVEEGTEVDELGSA